MDPCHQVHCEDCRWDQACAATMKAISKFCYHEGGANGATGEVAASVAPMLRKQACEVRNLLEAWLDFSRCGGQKYRHRSIIQMANHCGAHPGPTAFFPALSASRDKASPVTSELRRRPAARSGEQVVFGLANGFSIPYSEVFHATCVLICSVSKTELHW